MNPGERVALYNEAFPKWTPLAYREGCVVGGTWQIGACYKNPHSDLYGSYPRSYLERVHAMFPDAEKILHIFSGGLTESAAHAAAAKGECLARGEGPLEATGPFEIELVDLWGPEEGRHPTWQGDVMEMPEEWEGRFDLILADPPYSAEDADKYGTVMINRREVMKALRRVAALGGNLIWLDQQWPMHSKEQWKTWATIGLVRSTQHRVRVVSMFEAV